MSAGADARVAAVGARQHGVATLSQLRGAGLTERMIEGRVARGLLRRVHRGVYLVGPLEPPRAGVMAAVLACGSGARASHRTAGWLWEMAPAPGRGQPVEVKVPGRRVVRRAGILTYRASPAAAREVATVDGVPVTAPLPTLLDLSRVLPSGELEKCVARALRTRLVTEAKLAHVVAVLRGRRGIPALAAILARDGGPVFTRSALEDRFREAVRLFGLPEPAYNTLIGVYEVDCYWEEADLVVELDGAAFHTSWQSQSNDRRRDGDLAALGIRVIRVTWQQLELEFEPTMAKIIRAIAVGSERRRHPTGPELAATRPPLSNPLRRGG
jgi:very-short-patch-repair endonuclease